jgi:bifunctional non-homologous end joining protein LigD
MEPTLNGVDALVAKLKCPFVNLPDAKLSRWGAGVTADDMREMHLEAQVVVQTRFVEWTADGRLRHAVFVGVRPDKRAKDVHPESPDL